jgi:TPR repeat protein
MNTQKLTPFTASANAKIKVLGLTAYVVFTLFGYSNISCAAEETFIRSYTYQASEADSKLTSRTIALQEVKTELLGELGTHVSSLVKQRSSSDGKNIGTIEIETLTAGISKVEILEEKWDGAKYVLKAQLKADPDDVLKSLNKMFNERQKEEEISQLNGDLSKMQDKNNNIAESLSESRKEATEALAEIARLKKQLSEKQTEQSAQTLKAQYQHQVDRLTVNEWFNSGLNERNSGNNSQAVNWFRKAAEAGHTGGMTQLGFMYAQGKGVEQNDVEAFKLFHRAAEAGNVNSMFKLGMFLLKGRGVAENDSEAFSWLRKAANAGNAGGMTQLGIMYKQGKGVEKNNNEAINWFRKAASLGNKVAQNNLNKMGYP